MRQNCGGRVARSSGCEGSSSQAHSDMTDEHKRSAWLEDGSLSLAYMDLFDVMPIKGRLQDEEAFRESLREALHTGTPDPHVTWRDRMTDQGWRID